MATTANAGMDVAPHRPRRGRRKPYLFVALGLLLLVGALAALKGAQIGTLIKFGKRAQAAGPPPETVSSFLAQEQTWNETLESVGSVSSSRGVSIGNDAPGVVSKIAFESGATVRAGVVLIELDASVERAELAAARARRELAATNAARTRTLAESGSIPQSQRDTDEAQLAAATGDERAIAAQIERKIVRAPFAGKLGIRLVNIGQYLPPGTPITVLESDESSYVDFTLPQQSVGSVAVGMPVELSLETGDGGVAPPAQGKIYAIEPALDPATRNVKLRSTVPSERNDFRPGMFIKVSVVQPMTEHVVAVPATAIVHASYGDSVFVIEPDKAATGGTPAKIVRQQFVRLGDTRGDFIAVTNGVKPGDEVVTAGAFKLRNRARVVVNNDIKVRPELAPRPANR